MDSNNKYISLDEIISKNKDRIVCPQCKSSFCCLSTTQMKDYNQSIILCFFCIDCEFEWGIAIEKFDYNLLLTVFNSNFEKIDYHKYIQSDEWKQKADDAKERADHKCQICNSNGTLHAHHRTYERLGNELPEDITVLCSGCHGKFHDKIP